MDESNHMVTPQPVAKYRGKIADIARRTRAFCAELGRLARESRPSVVGFLDKLIEMETFVSAFPYLLQEVMKQDADLATSWPDPFPRIAIMLHHSMREWPESSPAPFTVSGNDRELIIRWDGLEPVTISVAQTGFLVRSGPITQMVSPIAGSLPAANAISRGLIYGHPAALSLIRRSPEYLVSFMCPGNGRLPIIMHRRLLQEIDAWVCNARNIVDPGVKRMLDLIHGVGMRIPEDLLKDMELWGDPWIQKDLESHRAARVAAAFIDKLAPDTSPCEAMRNWQDLFSRDGRSSRSLRRTLINHHHSIPGGLLVRLPAIPVDRPLLGRWDLQVRVWARTTGDYYPRGPATGLVENLPLNLPILESASDTDLAECFAFLDEQGIMNHDLPNRDRRRTQVAFLLDYPERYHGNIIGLARRSIAWHQAGGWNDEHEMASSAKTLPCQVFPMPPWPLPQDSRIRHLATTDDLIEESQVMHHCIASYRANAINGHGFYFHVDHEKGQASVELDRHGNVVQVFGRGNSTNAACTWAQQYFTDHNTSHARASFPKLTESE